MDHEYERLQKKYNLPDFEVLNDELDLSGWEEAKNLPRFIVKRIGERIEFFAEMVGNFLQPDSNPSTMYELEAFSEEERDNLPKTYKKVMRLHRAYLERELSGSEKEYAAFILEFFKEWEDVKKDLNKMLSVMKRSWEQELKLKLDLEYYG